MEAFEKEFLDIIPNIKFRSVTDTFQEKLKKGIPKIKQSPNVFVLAEKARNIYEMPEQQHKTLLHDNLTKTYKKAAPKLETPINLEAKNMAEVINLDDRIECIATAIITQHLLLLHLKTINWTFDKIHRAD